MEKEIGILGNKGIHYRHELLFMALHVSNIIPQRKPTRVLVIWKNQLIPRDLCDWNYERRVGTRVLALLEVVENDAAERAGSCYVKNSEFRKGCGIDGCHKECSGLRRRKCLVQFAHLRVFNHCLRFPHFQCLGRRQKWRIEFLPKLFFFSPKFTTDYPRDAQILSFPCMW